jgi:HSP20 family protein
MESKKGLSSYLKRYRDKADITQGELAEKLEVSRQSIIALESGKCIPSVFLALRIGRFFEIPVEFIFREAAFDLEDSVKEIVEEDNDDSKGGEQEMQRNLMPWSPWRDMMSMREMVDRFFEEPTGRISSDVFHPTISIRETSKNLIIEADIPGVKEDDLDIEIENDKVIIKGERKHEQEVKREDYYHMESSFGSFSRMISLPSNVNAEKADAEIKEGVLRISIPKEEQKKPKKISVKTLKK